MKLAIVGSALAGGAVQIIDILLGDGLAASIRIYDDHADACNTDVLGVPVVGQIDQLFYDFLDGIVDSAIVAVGSIDPRQKLYQRLHDKSIYTPNIVSSRAIVSASASLGAGNVILPLVYIGPRVIVGNNNYITTASVINHDSMVGSHCYFSTSVNVAGRVCIGDRVRLDTSASISADAKVLSDSLIGPGESFGPVRGR